MHTIMLSETKSSKGWKNVSEGRGGSGALTFVNMQSDLLAVERVD